MSSDQSFASHSFRPGLGFWQVRLFEAREVQAVIWVIKDFLATWPPEEIRALPPACVPGRIRDADDVALYAFHLVNAQFESSLERPQLDRMAGFMAAAASRLSQLAKQEDSDTSGTA
jgi:hypothetical protein